MFEKNGEATLNDAIPSVGAIHDPDEVGLKRLLSGLCALSLREEEPRGHKVSSPTVFGMTQVLEGTENTTANLNNSDFISLQVGQVITQLLLLLQLPWWLLHPDVLLS